MSRILTNLIQPLPMARVPLSIRFSDLVDLALTWMEVAGQRRQLAALDDRMLSDVGLSHADVDRETSRRFWDTEIRRR